MWTLIQDLRFGSRMLWKKPGFTLIAVITLALGIGANTMIFSAVNAVLLRPLPYAEPDWLMWVTESGPDFVGDPIPHPDFLEWRERSRTLTGIAAYINESLNLTGVGEPERLLCGKVTADFFALLGVAPLLGRAFLPGEDKPGGERVVMMSHGLWQRRFGADPSVLGRRLALNGESYTIIGILPPAFRFHEPFELWAPLAVDWASELRIGRVYLLDVIARLKPGVSAEQAEAEMGTSLRRLEQEQPKRVRPSGARVNLTPLQKQIVGDVRLAMWVLLGAVGFVLLIACANVANLLLARAIERRREMAVRAALGASRWRLIRQLLAESLLLALAGGALGAMLALWGVDLIVKLSPAGLTGGVARMARIAVDATTLGFTLAASILTGLLFGLTPALAAVISQSLARQSFPGQDPLGKQLRGPMSLKPLSVVGVVGDVRRQGLAEASTPEIYLPYLQTGAATMTLMIRADGDPNNLIAAARSQALAVDRNQPIYDARTMEDRLAELVAPQRFNLFLLSLFAALALLLGAIGVYGVMAYSVTQRTHEIGVRLALGAKGRDILKLVLKQGMIMALIGVVIGLIASLALTRLMKGLLFAVSATDPMTFIIIPALLTIVALLACWVPARRAAKVDPMIALRCE